MKYILALSFLFSGLNLLAQTTLKTHADLSNVMVYRSGVEMNHKAKLSLPAGSSEIVIDNVANAMDEKTIQVGANANITILSLRFAKDYLKDQVKKPSDLLLKDSIEQLKLSLVRWDNQKQAEQSLLAILDKNSAIGNQTTGVSVAELMKFAEYYKTKKLEVSNNISKIDEQVTKQQALISKFELQLYESSTVNQATGGQIVLQVMARNPAMTDFNISYICPNAGWTAFYDLRVDRINEPLALSYKANVFQNTGIDWGKVKLILSTGNPSISGSAPDINPWFLAFQQDYRKANLYGSVQSISEEQLMSVPISNLSASIYGAAPGVQVTSGGGQPGASPDIQMRGPGSIDGVQPPLIVLDGNIYNGSLVSINPKDVASMTFLKNEEAISLYGPRAANGVIVIKTKNKTLGSYTTQTENDLNTTFDIDIPYDIASNGKPNSVSLQEYQMPVHYQYLAIPKIDPDAFLMADITSYEKMNLLPGEGNIIFQNMYVGKSIINPGITNDTLSLSMGRDKQIVIKRERISALTSTKSFGNSKKQVFTYEIKIRNGKKDAISLVVKDQYPVSTDKDLEIELLESSGATVNKETGILNWNLNIAPGETKKVTISYSVKAPTSKNIANL